MLLLYPRNAFLWSLFRNLFTFHYASTLSFRRLLPMIGNIIYIPLCFYFITGGTAYFIRRNLNLHSTMLLLYRWITLWQIHQKLIYIPLCFYFIGMSVRLWPPLLPFTFHYASTLSGDRNNWQGWSNSFTFHYASTLSKATKAGNQYELPIYIPLCFYFIVDQVTDPCWVIRIYIPLCFYFILFEDTNPDSPL